MKSSILLLALTAAAFTSCTTAYKTGQTPDDVYFSPTRPQDEYVVVEKNDDRRYQGSDEYYDDRYLRMRVSNRTRWSELDDWYYYGNRYNYFYYPQTGLYYNPWTPNTYWNTYYNPYYGGHYGGGGVIIDPRSNLYTKPRTTNLNTYNNSMLTNSRYSNPKTSPVSRTNNIFQRANASGSSNGNGNYNNTRSTNGSGLRNIFGNNNNSSSNTNSNSNSSSSSRPATTTSSSSSSPSSSGSSGTNAPVRKF